VELEDDGLGAVALDDLALAAVAGDAREGHAGDADAEERRLDLGEALGADDGGDELHGAEDWGRGPGGGWVRRSWSG
jgi:hypothetical protein